MSAEYSSKHGNVARAPYELYMMFVDMRNFVAMLPEDKKKDVSADFDTLNLVVQNFNIGIKVTERIPYSRIVYEDNGAPFRFKVTVHCDEGADPAHTDFHLEVGAELNLMMKMMLGSKIKESLDKLVDAMENPAGFASDFKF